MEKKRKKLKYGNIIALIVIVLGIGFTIFSSIHIIKWYLANKENSRIKESLQESIVVKKIENPKNKEENKEEYQIDFKELKEKNNDTVGYVKVNNTSIDYVVVRGNDNEFYLKHNFEKNYNIAGWIFADYRNKLDGTDKNIVIFGHNTKDGSMFGTLKNVISEEWYKNEENHKVVLVTEKGTYYYQVFSTYSTKPEEYYLNTKFKGDEFDKFVKELKSRSVYDYKVDVSKEDKILTLTSCLGDSSRRVVLHAKLIK